MTLNEQFKYLNFWRSKKLCSFYCTNVNMKTWLYHFFATSAHYVLQKQWENYRNLFQLCIKLLTCWSLWSVHKVYTDVEIFDVVVEASLVGHNPLHLFCDFWQSGSAREARMLGRTDGWRSLIICVARFLILISGTRVYMSSVLRSLVLRCARDCAIEKANFVRPSANLSPFCVAKVSKTRQHSWDAERVKDSTPLLFSLSSAPQVRCLEKVFRSNARHQHQHFSQSRVKKLPINLGHQTSPSR